MCQFSLVECFCKLNLSIKETARERDSFDDFTFVIKQAAPTRIVCGCSWLFLSFSLLYPFNLSPVRLDVVVPEVKVITHPPLFFLFLLCPSFLLSVPWRASLHGMMGDSLILCPGVKCSLSVV